MKAIEKKRKGKQKYFNQTHFVYDKLAKNEGHSNHLISSVALSVLYSKISPRGQTSNVEESSSHASITVPFMLRKHESIS